MDGSGGKMMQKTTLINAPQQDIMWQGGAGGAVSVLTTVYSGVPPSYNPATHQGYSMSNMMTTNNVYRQGAHRVASGSLVIGGACPADGSLAQQEQLAYGYQGGDSVPAYHGTASAYPVPSAQFPHGSGPAYGPIASGYQHHGSESVYVESGRASKNVNPAHSDMATNSVVGGDDAASFYAAPTHWNSNLPAGMEAPQAAAAAAAMNAVQVAAAAVATATATAVALDQSQLHHQQYSQQNVPYCGQQHFAPSVGMVQQGQYMTNSRLVPNRMTASIPAGYGPPVVRNRNSTGSAPLNGIMYQNASAVAKNQAVHASMSVSPTYGSGVINGSRSYGPHLAYATTMRNPGPAGSAVTNSMMRSAEYGSITMQPAYATSIAYDSLTGGPTTPNYQQVQQQRLYMNNSGSNIGLCASTSNPTPPMTPVNSSGIISPPGYASSVMNSASVMGPVDLKPLINCQLPDDNILTLPVPDGIVMTPFRLEHNSPVTQHAFFLNESMFNFLCSSPENDLQLKCFHQDEKTMACNWPPNANVQICVNGAPVSLLNNNKSLFIKQLCQPNKNTLQISVQQCSCSHLFELSLVQRINIETVRENLMRRKILPQDQARDKIKRLFFTGDLSNMRQSDGYAAEIEQMSIIVSLRCPLSMQKIRYPARGQMCRHPQCFDVETFLRLNKDRNKWYCPLCKIELHLDSLEIDQYLWGIMCNFKDSLVDEIIIDSALMWKPVDRTATYDDSRTKIKEEPTGRHCNNSKRFKSDTCFSPYNDMSLQGTLPATPGVVTSSGAILSPAFVASGSPVHPASGQGQRRRSGNNNQNKPATPQASTPSRSSGPPNACVTSSSSTSLASPLYATAATPGTPACNPPSVELITAGNALSMAALQSQTSQPNGAQSDTCFASASAPYTPASVGSNGSLTLGNSSGAGNNINGDNYGHDLYGELESLLTESNPNDTSGLFADSIDPMELSKYLDNGDSNANMADRSAKNVHKSADSSYSMSHPASGSVPKMDESIDNSLIKNNMLYNNSFGEGSVDRQLTVDVQKQGGLSNLDDVLSFLN